MDIRRRSCCGGQILLLVKAEAKLARIRQARQSRQEMDMRGEIPREQVLCRLIPWVLVSEGKSKPEARLTLYSDQR